MESASRMEPSPASANRASACGSARIPSWVGDLRQLRHDVIELDRVETEMLAAGAYGLGNILRLCRRHHEDDVIRRFLQRFQQGVESRIGDLMGLVEQVYFVAIARRGVSRRVAQFANLVDPAIGGGIDLHHVEGVAGAYLLAGIANPARFGGGPLGAANFVAAIQRHCQDSGDGRFADAAVPTEDVSVGHPLLFQSVGQSTGHVVLAGDIGEALRTVFAGENLVSHREGSRRERAVGTASAF